MRVWMQRKEGWCPLWREGSSSAVTEAGAGGQGVGPMGGSHVRAVAAGPGAQVQAEAALVLDTVRSRQVRSSGRRPGWDQVTGFPEVFCQLRATQKLLPGS